MHDFALIKDLALIWTIALITGQICVKFKQPVIAGYMLAGIAIGPHGLKLISQMDQIQVLAEFGVAMLLFTLGVDLSLKQVMSSAKRILSAGITQMVGTIAVAWLIAACTGLANSPAAGLLFGCICAISSSVVMSKVLMDRGESESIHGQILIPLSLVQDLSLVVIIPFLPVLQEMSTTSNADLSALLLSVVKAVIFIGAIIWGATKVVPRVLAESVKSNSREIFLLTILVLCLAIALLSESLGLSIALGAFLAGIMMSESTYAHQALHDMSPLRDVFSTIFFVSVGMFLDPLFIVQHWLEVIVFVVLLILGKALIGTFAAMFATSSRRSAILVGFGLAQIGEFSFVLLTLGYESKIITDAMYNLFFAGAVITMIASPGLMSVIPRIILRRFESGSPNEKETSRHTNLRNHVIVCGFGRIGRNLGLVLEAYKIPFVVIELNANIIEDLAVRGIPHIYGDAMGKLALVKANLKHASCLVLSMPDPLSATTVAAFAREKNPDIKIVARAHRTDDIRIFRAAGVNAVVQPEFEASIEITRLVLHGLERSTEEVKRALEKIRTIRYAVFQPDIDQLELADSQPSFGEDQMGIWFKVDMNDQVCGRSIRELNIRGRTGATISAIKHDQTITAFPEPDLSLNQNDEVYAVGTFEQLANFEEQFGLSRTEQ
ncbi:MAG: cation:proton antiporter [Candidatus Obscuribacterales bacterium]|nr:cation:proton antiporter [Candidatus Obscuribacterales bacterium]